MTTSARKTQFSTAAFFVLTTALSSTLLASDLGPRVAEIGSKAGDGRLVEEAPGTRLWLLNLDARSAEVRIGRGRAGAQETSLGAGVLRDFGPTPPNSELRIWSETDVFVLRASAGFDPAALEIEARSGFDFESVGGEVVGTVRRPDWVSALAGLSRSEGVVLRSGEEGRASVALQSGAEFRGVRIAVSFLEPGTAAVVRLIDADGNPVESLVASASRPLRWQTAFGWIPEERRGDAARVELQVLRGRALATTSLITMGGEEDRLRPITASATVGNASFNYRINWRDTPPLYYTVENGPAGTCGDLHTYRNGGWLIAPGWLCTDASGYAQKGPWTWDDIPSDQTDNPAFIRWPGGDETTYNDHIFDKTCSRTEVDSTSPPTDFRGSASDALWGAGFDSGWTETCCTFFNRTTQRYWSPSTGSYSSTTAVCTSATVGGMPSLNVSWSCTPPPSGAHTSLQEYEWSACIADGYCCISGVHVFTW